MEVSIIQYIEDLNRKVKEGQILSLILKLK